MKNTVLMATAVLILALFVPACTTYDIREGTTAGTNVQSVSTEARLNRVGFLTKGLERRVAIQSTGTARTPTNTLEVNCVLRNRTDYEQRMMIRTQYFGEERNPNEGPNEWQTVIIPQNGIQTYKTYSAGIDATYYYIEIQELP